MDLRGLEEELKKLGVTIVSSRQETIISIRIKGLAGKALDRALRLCDQLLQEKVKNVIKTCSDPSSKLFVDPTFGPSPDDPQGAAALCKTGATVPSKGGSQHQMKVLGLLKGEKLRWERPEYAADDDDAIGPDNQVEDNDDDATDERPISQEHVFSSSGALFSDGVSSGDVIQGNLGDCWFLSALSVVATRSDLLEQTFWRGDKNKSKGVFVCKFMKNFVWNYVMIDDRLPIYGFSKTKAGKPYFARCRDPNELWVSLLEKAYAKLHRSYEALIGGFIDVALNDLTGTCSEQVIMKTGYPGFGEDPFAPAKPQQKRGDPFWEKLLRYKSSGTLMGCSIQPPPTAADKNVVPESSAGNGLYFKHAYALVDAAEVKTTKAEQVRLVKLRNPWGMGEWTGPWSDSSEERVQNQDVIEQYFKILKRRVGGNLSKRVFLSLNGKGELKIDEISQEEFIEVNANDGTFFMSYDAWVQYFTHFFAGIDFPDAWHGRRVEGCWNEASCGGNTTKSTWINNPRFELVVQERSKFFISLSQEDPRGKGNLKIVPIGFHICSLTPISQDKGSKCEIKEPPGKSDEYYRLYKEKDRLEFKKGIRPEQLPPAIIPGSVIKGIDEDGVPQPAYTFKQAVSVDVVMEPGKYCVIPSMYMRTDKDTGKTNVGSFWVSVYSDKLKFTVEGGERIVEEEEGDEEEREIATGNNIPVGPRASFMSIARISGLNSPGKKSDSSVSMESLSVIDQRRRFEDAKDELLAQAKAKGIGLRELKMEFAKTGAMKKLDMRKKMLSVGFKADELSDEKINVLFSGLDAASKGCVDPERVLNMFESEIHEDQMACEIPEVEDDEIPDKIHDEGVLSLELRGARDLPITQAKVLSSSELKRPVVRLPAIEFSNSESNLRKVCAIAVCERHPTLANAMRPILKRRGWLPASMRTKSRIVSSDRTPLPEAVAHFYAALNEEVINQRSDKAQKASTEGKVDDRSSRQDSTIPIVTHSNRGDDSSTARFSAESKLALHRSNRMQALEEKRCRRLADLQRKKHETLGDRWKAASLPRLIGGRKSGSTSVQCTDCGSRALVPGRAGGSDTGNRDGEVDNPPSYICSGSRCFNALCSSCYLQLPKSKKVCEDCYEHELAPPEAFGSQLRTLLIDKIGSATGQRAGVEAFFRSIDSDNSGALSYDEFAKAVETLDIQPALSDEQLQSLMQQFDTNKDGEISLVEFKDWVFKDQIWQPGVVVESTTASQLVASREIRSAVIAPLLESILDAAFEAHLLASSITQWMVTTNSMTPHAMRAKVVPDLQHRQETEQGSILLQRVQTVKMAASTDSDSGDAAVENSIDQVFERYDADGSGKIDANEFRELLAALGMQLSESDTDLLMRRVEATATIDGAVDVTEFRSYVEGLLNEPSGNCRVVASDNSLIDKLLKLEKVATGDASKQGAFQDLVQQFHWNLTRLQAAQLRATLRRRSGLSLSIGEIQRISNALHFREVVPSTSAQPQPTPVRETASDQDQLLELNNSGDVLNHFLFTLPGSLSTHLASFSLRDVCAQLGTHLEGATKTTSTSGIWRTVFGVPSILDSIDQRVFLDKLLLAGFKISSSPTENLAQRLVTKLLVAIAFDALRCQAGVYKANDESSWLVTFNLFTVLLQHSKIDAIEKKFAHALRSYLQFCQGNQSYLVDVALEQDNLVIRAYEPAHKYRMDFVLRSHEFSRLAIAQLGPNVWRSTNVNADGGRHAAFVRSPGGLLTETTHPRLHDAIVALLSRLRLRFQSSMSSQHTMTPYLTLVEDDAFLQTLETMFARSHLPFFWSVSPTTLEFTIDGDYLTQMKRVSFHQLIAETLSTKPAAKPLHSLLKFTSSSLSVRYEIIGQNAVFESTWVDFQALLSGHQNTFALLELRPQGDMFMTKVDRTGGNGAPKWSFQQCITLKEPERQDHRMDRPVVYTDTVRVSAVPDGSSIKRITFSPVSGGKSPASVGHFVVLSVRKALPEKPGEKSRLYCTAYDPFTSSDFAVEGTPANWESDLFNPTVHPDFETQWFEIVKDMFLGPALTPKVLIKVFNKHAKVERLIGECEVAISSAIAHEGHIFDDWFPLLHPSDPSSTTGALNLAFHFDSKKVTDPTSTLSRVVRVSDLAKDSGPVKANEERAANTADYDDAAEKRRIRELEHALEQSDKAKREAQEQARQAKAQLQQQVSLTSLDENNEVVRWKTKLEQVRREQEAEQDKHEKRVATLQAELLRLEQLQRRDDANAIVEVPASVVVPLNLRQAALTAQASAHDILSAMKDIMTNRTPDRPYNGLKKAIAAVADVPGKVSVAAFDDVLDDFGLTISTPHRKKLLNILDPESKGRISIEDFFIKLCGDAESNSTIQNSKSRPLQTLTPRSTPPVEPAMETTSSLPAPASPTRAANSATLPAPTQPQKLSWKEMKKFLLLNLPEGWETRYTEKGRPYFCNHENRSTQWKHPVPEVDAKYAEWVKENGANFQRLSSTSAPTTHKRG